MKGPNIKNILFIPYKDASFTRCDEVILRKLGHLETLKLCWESPWSIIYSVFKQIVWMLDRVHKTDLVVCSFAGYSTIVPTVLGKVFGIRVLIILHGTECAIIPSINYGMGRKWLLKRVINLSLKLCSKVIVSNETLLTSTDTYTDGLVGNQGVLNHYDIIESKFLVIPYGFDSDFWNDKGQNRLSKNFVSVVLPGQELRRDLSAIINLAKALPEFRFTIIGLEKEAVSETIPKNMNLKGILAPSDMAREFGEHQFFLQLSVYEGFGCAMAEAMLCGCIPIGTNVNKVPDIIGNTGFVIDRRMEGLMIKTLSDAVKYSSPKVRQACIAQIKFNYSLDKREKAFRKLVASKSLTDY